MLCVLQEALKSVVTPHFLITNQKKFLQGYIAFWNNNPIICDDYDMISFQFKKKKYICLYNMIPMMVLL